MEKLVLIDGNSLINRAFYAMPVLSTKDGTYTNAVYGFMNMFFKMLSEEKPTYVGVAFDLKAPTFRHKMYAEYKGTRKPMPEELRPQIPLLKEVLSLMNIKTFELEGSEADDIIGTIAKATKVKTIIITGDKDSFQLVDDETEVHFTKRGITDVEIYNNENFTEKTSLIPSQIIELKALMGDSSDNIPGISGIGEKTALNLLKQFSNIENLYQNTDKLKGKLQEKIILGKESAFLSKTLATIDCNSGVDTDLSKMTVSLPFSSAVKEKFINLEFKSLYNKQEWFSNDALASQTVGNKPISNVDILEIESLDSEIFSKHFERLSVVFGDNSINLSDGKAEYVIKTRQSLLDDGFNTADVLNALSHHLNGKTPLIVYGKKDIKHFIFNSVGLSLNAKADDTCIMKYLCDFSSGDQNLTQVLTEYGLSTTTPAYSQFILYDMLKEKLAKQDLTTLYTDVELPLADVLFDMEQSGFKVDYTALLSAGEKYRGILSELENEIRSLVDEPTLNVNSPKQLGDVIFEKLKLGKGKKQRTDTQQRLRF